METKETGFLEVAPGNFSAMRLVFVVGFLWAMAFTTTGAFILAWTSGEIIAVFTAITTVLTGLKLGQKYIEKPAEAIKPEA